MFSTINWQIINSRGYLTIDQPPSNKMNSQFFIELSTLTSEIIPKSEIKSIIIHGKGRHFSAGADIDDLLEKVEQNNNENGYNSFLFQNNKSFSFFDKTDIPVIAVIQGVCIGSAFELALSCHFRICAHGSLMGLPEVAFNLMPGCGGTQKLPEIAGRVTGLEALLEGKNFDPNEAYKLKLIDAIVPKKEALTTAEVFANFCEPNYNKGLKNYYIKKFFCQKQYNND